jgi:hypothetical protein
MTESKRGSWWLRQYVSRPLWVPLAIGDNILKEPYTTVWDTVDPTNQVSITQSCFRRVTKDKRGSWWLPEFMLMLRKPRSSQQYPTSCSYFQLSRSIACWFRTWGRSHHVSSLYCQCAIHIVRYAGWRVDVLMGTWTVYLRCQLVVFRMPEMMLTRRGIHWRNRDRVCVCQRHSSIVTRRYIQLVWIGVERIYPIEISAIRRFRSYYISHIFSYTMVIGLTFPTMGWIMAWVVYVMMI